ncbi:hypothetical protein E2C06_31060 [Dankookia rubra]|uniref:Uncharacterized protein n=1 Tax=Dankookia rubra TaxID=1442381 RepID=A0A4R5Q8A2_9PROT|nr:hypothetical protein [Dankookia rubra]TDH58729.1 hypothetical protein E2C06_31060 [Dankookia rubra]
MTDPMGQPETTLEMARRHVAEGETRCARHAEIVRKLIAGNHLAEAKAAKEVLEALQRVLTTSRDHLRAEEARASGSGGHGMTASPRDQLVATDRLRRAVLAFRAAQILVLTQQRQGKALSQADLDTVQDSAAEAVTAFQAFSAAGLIASAGDQRLLALVQKYLVDGAT